MLNYLWAEFYKVFHRKYTWITLAAALALEAGLVFGFVSINDRGGFNNFYEAASMVVFLRSLGFYVTLITGDMVFAGQYKNATLKNEVSFGLSRTRIYLGKLMAQTALSILYCVVMLGFYLGLCWAFLSHDSETQAALREVGYCLATVFPLWVGGQAATCAMYFLIGSELAAALAGAGLFTVVPNVVWAAAVMVSGPAGHPVGDGLMKVYQHLPTAMAGEAVNMVGDWAYCGKAWLVCAVWVIAFTALGIWGFRKKEIK